MRKSYNSIFRPKKFNFRPHKRFNPNFDNEETVLFKRLITSTVGILAVLAFVIFGLQFFGPQVFSVFGLLSLERFQKKDEVKFQTQIPIFLETIKASKEKKISLKGVSEIDSTVKLFVNGPQVQETKADGEGKFFFNDIELIEGGNVIFAKATANSKNESEKSETLNIAYDTKKPEITLISPKNGESIESVDSRVSVKGKINEPGTVTVNTHLTIVDSEGNFQTLISVKEGSNKILIEAKDEAGNQATSSSTINFDKR